MYAAFQAQLDPAYEYRFSWNIRAPFAGKKVVFRLGTANGTAGTDVSEVFSLGPVNAFVVRQSNAFTVPQNGNYFLIATPPPSGYSATLLHVYFDDFLLERRALTVPVLNFAAAEVTLAEGDSTQICVSVADPLVTSYADIVLSSAADPHLSSFTPITLEFPAGSTDPQCFVVQTEPANGQPDLNHTYTLELQNLTGGAVLGEVAALTVTVTDDEELLPGCPWAGEDKTICAGTEEGTTIGCPEMSGTEGYCYRWLPETGLSSPYSAMTAANPMETTTYTLYVTDIEGNLQAMDQVIVTVLPQPELAITPNSTIICIGQSITLQATEGLTSYVWSTNATTDNIVISSPGTYSVTATENHILSVDQQLNCTNTAEAEVSDASNDPEAVVDYFSEKGFYCIPIPVNVLGPEALTGQPGAGLPRDLCADASCSGSTTPCVQDHANVAIAIGSEELPNLEDAILENLDFFATTFGYEAPKGFITTSQDVCNCPGYLDGIYAQFEAAELSFWVHIWDNPPTETDQLCILTNVPSSDAHYPDSEAHRNELDAIMEETVANSDMAEFESNAEQAVYALMFGLLDNQLLDWGEAFAQTETTNQSCSAQPSELICLAPSAIPLKLPDGTIPFFGVKQDFIHIVVDGALTGFLTPEAHFRGRSNFEKNLLKGYFRNDSKEPYEYPSPLIPQGVCSKVTIGNRIKLGLDCFHVKHYVIDYAPANFITNQTGEGGFVGANTFFAGQCFDMTGEFPPVPDYEYASVGCISISYENLNQPITYKLNKNPGNTIVNWQLLVVNEFQQTEWITVRQHPTDPNELEYFRYDRLLCTWVEWTDVPNWAPYIISTDLMEAVWDGLIVPVAPPAALIVVSVAFPVVGTIADGLTFAISVQEGDIKGAAISLIAAGVGGACTVFTKYVNGVGVKALRWADDGGEIITGLTRAGDDLPHRRTFDYDFLRALVTAHQTHGVDELKLEKLIRYLHTAPIDFLDAFKLNPNLLKAWAKLDDLGSGLKANIPALKVLSEPAFFSRFEANGKLLNFLNNLTDAGRTSLADNIVNWIKLYDARAALKSGNVNGAVNILEGTLGTPQVYYGANYVDVLSLAQATKLNGIVAAIDDVPAIASNLEVNQQVIHLTKQHLFIDEHLVEKSAGEFVKGRFTASDVHADWWNQVKVGNMSNAENLKKLIAHEYIESKLMKEGMHYRGLGELELSSYNYGAHELSVHDFNFNFSHWVIMGKNSLGFELSHSLDNIDDIVSQIKLIEGL